MSSIVESDSMSVPDAHHAPLRSSIVVAVLTALTCLLLLGFDFPDNITDSYWYLKMASGQGDEVVRPFAARILHPFLAGSAARLLGASIENGFRVVAVFSLLLFCVATACRLHRGRVSWQIAVPILLTPLPLLMLRHGYMPDLAHAALLSLFLVLVDRRFLPAMGVLLALFLCREATALIAIPLVLWLIARRQLKSASIVLLVSGASLILVRLLVGSGHSNAHGIDALTYVFFKMPFNLSRNLFGLELWVNTIEYCTPSQVWELPGWLARGSVHAVGVCGFNHLRPLHLVSSALTTFGVLPCVGVFWWRRCGRTGFATQSLSLIIACSYGLLTLALTPTMGPRSIA